MEKPSQHLPQHIPADAYAVTHYTGAADRHRRRNATVRPAVGTPEKSFRHLSNRGRIGIACLVMFLCFMMLLLPAVCRAVTSGAQQTSSTQVGQALCRVFLNAGLPPTNKPLWTISPSPDTESTASSTFPTASDETEPPTEAERSTAAPDTAPTENVESKAEESRPVIVSPGESSCEATVPSAESGTAETVAQIESDPSSETATGEAPAETEAPDTTSVTPQPVESDIYGMAIEQRDMSESQRGPGHMWNDTTHDSHSLPGSWSGPWGNSQPVVLIICSHPFTGYADSAAGNVSDLAVLLAEDLRTRGVSVVLVNSAISGLTPDTSLRETYARTQALAKYYCQLYSDISLVIDLRRSAETVSQGVLLATDGQVEGKSCAQLRLIVDGLREQDDSTEDITFALALRRRLWDISPTLSRPVWWRSGQGILPADASSHSPLLLTIEVGAAGDTYARAAATIPYLGQSLEEVLKGKGR